MTAWHGSFTALVTPFHNGSLDEQALERLLDYQLAGHAAGIIPCATTGESPTVSPEEYRRILELTLKKAKGKAQVLAYTGTNDTVQTIARTQQAEKAGADGALVVTPYYNKPTQEGLYQHFKAVAKATKIRIMLYNVPGRTGVSIDPKTVARLAEIDNIVAIKEASGSLDQATAIIGLCGDGFAVFSGDDSLTLPMLAVGARGVVSVAANVAPKDTAQMVKCFLEGKIEEARKIHHKLFPLIKALFVETSPGPVKCGLNLMGMCHAELRMPLVDVSEGTKKLVKEELKRYGLLK
ncbi:MAG: 4-hydroxy-tetrahydrodipicolinate synthase [Candidatus Edwardsbacteria bacterium]|nr:4-hydroxy-tetrahydrodipicolinate synthase [Candidatus Edwardsbacteria bacterium]